MPAWLPTCPRMHPSSTEGWESQPSTPSTGVSRRCQCTPPQRRGGSLNTLTAAGRVIAGAMHPSSTEGWESQQRVGAGGRPGIQRCTPPQRRGGSLNSQPSVTGCTRDAYAPLLNGGVGVSTGSHRPSRCRWCWMHPSSTEGWESQLADRGCGHGQREPCTPPQRRGGSLNSGIKTITAGHVTMHPSSTEGWESQPRLRGSGAAGPPRMHPSSTEGWESQPPDLHGGVVGGGMHPSSTEGWESQLEAGVGVGEDQLMHPSSTEGWESQPAVDLVGDVLALHAPLLNGGVGVSTSAPTPATPPMPGCTPPQRRGGSLNSFSHPQHRPNTRMHPSSTEGWESQLRGRCRRRLKTRPMWRSRMRPRCCRVSSLPGLVF